VDVQGDLEEVIPTGGTGALVLNDGQAEAGHLDLVEIQEDQSATTARSPWTKTATCRSPSSTTWNGATGSPDRHKDWKLRNFVPGGLGEILCHQLQGK
jgi:hypothetical protein